MSMLDSQMDIHDLMNGDSLTRIISKCIRTKGDIVASDYYDEKGERNVLNFGHTIAHGIESASKNEVTHGNAVATGMLAEAYIGEKMGITGREVRLKIQEVIGKFSISLAPLNSLGLQNMIKYISNDKKASDGHVSMVIPEEIGKSQKIRASVKDIFSYMKSFTDSYNLGN